MSDSIPASNLFGIDTIHGSPGSEHFAWGYTNTKDDLILERISDNTRLVEIDQTDTNPINFPQGITVGDGAEVLSTDASIDATSLDGYDSTDFIRSNTDGEIVGDLNVTQNLTESSNDVLTVADDVDATTLSGLTVDGVRPAAEDDNTEVVTAFSSINFGGNISVSNDGDGTISVSVGSQSDVGDTRVNVSEDGSQVVTYAADINFTTGFDVSDDGDGTVSVSSLVASASDDGSVVLDPVSDYNFGTNLDVTDDGDGTVTIDATDTNDHTAVSNNGTEQVGSVGDINFNDGLSVSNDGDGSVTVNATTLTDADTLDGIDSSGFLRTNGSNPLTGDLDGGGYAINNLGGIGFVPQDNVTVNLPNTSGGSVTIRDPNNADDVLVLNEGSSTPMEAHRSVEFIDGEGIIHDPTGSTTTRLRPWRTGLGTLTGGGNLPSTEGMTIEADGTIALIETDNDEITGWFNTNDGSGTFQGGLRVGDRGGSPSAALDVRGDMNMTGEAKGFRFEVRQSDPNSPQTGRAWVRTNV